jgi:hypothetical protein
VHIVTGEITQKVISVFSSLVYKKFKRLHTATF